MKLAASIKAEGLYNPIVVRPNPDKPGRYILVQGRHRLFAVKKVLKEQSIRCTVLAAISHPYNSESADSVSLGL